MNKHYRWIPSTYFMQALPFAVVMILTSIFYKDFHIDNTSIAFYTSLLILPWSFKPIIAPLLENLAPKRFLTISAQLFAGFCLLTLALVLFLPHFFWISIFIFFILATVGSIHDTCSDGTYLINLNEQEQAKFVGVRIVFYQVARFFVVSGLVIASGVFAEHLSLRTSWQLVFIIAAIVSLMLGFYNRFFIPKHPEDSIHKISIHKSFIPVIKEIFKTQHLFIAALFIFMFNMPEAQLLKIVPLYLIDAKAHGGLDLSNINVGIIFGGFGIVAIMIGAFLSGRLVARYGVKRSLIPLCIATVLSNLFYLLLYFPVFHHLWLVTVVLCVAQFGYGISNGAFMTYLLYQSNNRPYQMSLYAYGTAIMAFGMSFAGSLSGLMQQYLGYHDFFLWIIIFGAIITVLTIITVKKMSANENLS